MTKLEAPRTAGRPKSLQKRRQILESASQLLLQNGFGNTSMDAVAKASGVSKQTVYSHFANKDALYNAVIETKCEEYRIEDASISLETQSLSDVLELIGRRFIQLLNDKNVIAMYKVVIGESKPGSPEAKLFYDAGPLHSIEMITKLLMAHPSSQLNETQAKEASLDFFNLLKTDFHMLSILNLPYQLSPEHEIQYARKVARKTLAIIDLIKVD
jgi:TetR/AcrR family transcriptional repressor of mexJK operon